MIDILNTKSAYEKANFDFKGSVQNSNDLSSKLTEIQKPDNETIKSITGNIDAKDLFDSYALSSFAFSNNTINVQGSLLDIFGSKDQNLELSKALNILDSIDLSELGYTGLPISSLNPQEVKNLVGENGFFGIEKTANRIADFVINIAKNDPEKLQKAKEGMLEGFEQAKSIFGGKLPDISNQTIKDATKKVNEKIVELGGHSMDIKA